MTETLQGAMNEKISNLSSWNEQLLSLKQEIASLYVEKLKEHGKLNWFTSGILENPLKTFLSSDIQDFWDALGSWLMVNIVWKPLLGDEMIADVIMMKDKIALAGASEQGLDLLKSEIVWWNTISSTVPESSTPIVNPPQSSVSSSPDISNTPTHDSPVENISTVQETFHLSGVEYSTYVKKVLDISTKYEWTPYLWWWISAKGFDCSWLWYYAFKEAGISFPSRFTANIFDKNNENITRNSVVPGDFMYWNAKPWQKKHSNIYHIEMVVEKPYFERWKWYVKTFGSSTDKGVYVDGKKTNKSGVWYRIREITEYRHFGRPSYYQQLAQYEKTWNQNLLAA